MNRLFRDMGAGVGLRAPHFDRFATSPPAAVSWIEVISENFMAWKGREIGASAERLLGFRRERPVFLHGVSLSIGSADPVDRDYLKRLKELVDLVEPEVVSDHLCWTGIDGENSHDLLPVPYTRDVLQHIVAKVAQVQDILGRRILIENPSSYLEFKETEMSESAFLGELAKKADCGILLDLNNVYVSSVNHGFDPWDYLREIPHERVGQIHLAGHRRVGDLLVDTHDADIPPAVWDLYGEYSRRNGPVSTMVERDGNIPAWEVLELEVQKIKEIHDERLVQAV